MGHAPLLRDCVGSARVCPNVAHVSLRHLRLLVRLTSRVESNPRAIVRRQIAPPEAADIAHSSTAHPEVTRNHFGAPRVALDRQRIVSGKRGHVVRSPARGTACAPLSLHVGRVLLDRAEPQVRRVAAGRVVASVAHAQVLGDRPVREMPRDAVRHRFGEVCPANPAIPKTTESQTPRPALRRMLAADTRPEVFGNVFHCRNIVAQPATVKETARG